MPTVSVIVPIFNTSAYLERCLLSLLAQSFKDFEIQCVDDCSTDNSMEIVASLARKDRRIRVQMHDRNLGAGGARNTGIRASASNYVAFVDSDDYVDNDLLRDAIGATRNGKYDLVCFGYRSINAEGRMLKRVVPRWQEIPDASAMKGRLLFAEPHPWDKLWRRSLFVDHNIWFPENAYWEDLATVPRLMFKVRNVAAVDKALYSYFDREDSTVNRITDRHFMDYLRALDMVKEFMISEGIYNGEREDFDEITRIVFAWYADRILASKTLKARESDRHIRHLALLAGAYISADDQLRANSSKQNIGVIRKFERMAQPVQAGQTYRWLPSILRMFSTQAGREKPQDSPPKN